MPAFTPNFNLEKPTPEEYYNVAVPNRNMDKIEGQLVVQEIGLAELNTKVEGAHQLVEPTTGKAFQIASDSNLNNLIESGFYRIGFNTSPVVGLPVGTYSIIVIRNNKGANTATDPVTQIIIGENTSPGGRIYTRVRSAAGVWTEVLEYVTSKLPVRLNAALTTGWTIFNIVGNDALTYYKDSFGIVRLKGIVNRSAAAGKEITQLPAGYRPIDYTLVSVGQFQGETVRGEVTLDIAGRLSFNISGIAATVPIDISFRTN